MPLLGFFTLIIILLGQWVGRIENWSKFDAFYWSFITACTVGFGDIRPQKIFAKVLAILIAFIGIMYTGMIVSITVTATTETFKKRVVSVEAKQVLNEQKLRDNQKMPVNN